MVGPRLLRVAALAVAMGLATLAPAQDRPALPDGRETARLVWTTLIAVDHANRTGNYMVLRDLGAPQFRAANDAARLAAIFATSRDQGLALGRIVLEVPTYDQPPRLLEDGLLYVKGGFPGRPDGVGFELLFQFGDGAWRLFGISLSPLPAAEAPAVDGTPQRPKG